jgi:hypothetical protein
MEITAIPPMTPPAMAPTFELSLPIGVGMVVFETGAPKVLRLVYPLAETEVPEVPSIMPGPTSG